MHITIYTNKIKKKFIIEANKEYLKRLSKYCKIKIIETNEYKKELSKIYNQTLNKIYTININNACNTITSPQLAKYFDTLSVTGNSKIFIFLNSNDNFNFNNNLTLSKMNIDCELLCTIVLEQIYRSYKILGNEPYHK